MNAPAKAPPSGRGARAKRWAGWGRLSHRPKTRTHPLPPPRGRGNRIVGGCDTGTFSITRTSPPIESPPRRAGRGRGEVGAEGLWAAPMNAPTSSGACGRHLPRPAGKAKTGEPFRLASLGTSPTGEVKFPRGAAPAGACRRPTTPQGRLLGRRRAGTAEGRD